jgi:hypothetical protein
MKDGTMTEGFLAGWSRGQKFHRGHLYEVTTVMVPIEAAPSEGSLESWARALWLRAHGSLSEYRAAVRAGNLRKWTTGVDRAVEWIEYSSGTEVDPAWGIDRYQPRGGYLLHIGLTVYGVPSNAERAELRRAFIDGPLGGPP